MNLGERARGVPDDEIDALIEEMRAERDAKAIKLSNVDAGDRP